MEKYLLGNSLAVYPTSSPVLERGGRGDSPTDCRKLSEGILPRRCHRSPLARLRRRPLPAHGEGGAPSPQRLHAAAARSKDWRGLARSGQAAQDAVG